MLAVIILQAAQFTSGGKGVNGDMIASGVVHGPPPCDNVFMSVEKHKDGSIDYRYSGSDGKWHDGHVDKGGRGDGWTLLAQGVLKTYEELCGSLCKSAASLGVPNRHLKPG